MAARREITKKVAKQYERADKAAKTELLDALVATTGWTRDHARRAIRQAAARVGPARARPRKPRPRKYSYDALLVLQEIWRLTGQPCGKYLAVVMDDMVARLQRHGELGRVAHRVTDQVLDEVRAMSAATIDRYLKPHRDAAYPAASLGGTKPAQILRSTIMLRTCLDDPITHPGFWELDTVAHCGHTLKGDFLWTLTATSPVTGWTLLRTIKNKAFAHVHTGLDWVRRTAPVPVTAMDFDNGSEFLNWAVVAWADTHQITLSRGRPYHHNDNAHAEQRNGDWVRRHAFRYRYETDPELDLLNRLWDALMLRRNFLLPCVKATGWTTTSNGRKKRVYDSPQTPYQRLLATGTLDPDTATQLAATHEALNPARLTRQITSLQTQLIAAAKTRTTNTRPDHPDISREASTHTIRTS